MVQEYMAPFELMSFVLSLLLVFRTNSAYGRWWEARIFWGLVTQLTRDIMRETLTFAGMDDGPLIDMVGFIPPPRPPFPHPTHPAACVMQYVRNLPPARMVRNHSQYIS